MFCIYLNKRRSCQAESPLVYIFFRKMTPGGHFGWPKITFDRISRHFRSIHNCCICFHKMAAGGHFGWPKITFDRISRHFRSIRNFFFKFCFKMAAGGHFGSPIWAILDDRKSLLITFLAISDQCATYFLLNLFSNGRRGPFWKSDLRQKQ